jgi:hypothetical protein
LIKEVNAFRSAKDLFGAAYKTLEILGSADYIQPLMQLFKFNSVELAVVLKSLSEIKGIMQKEKLFDNIITQLKSWQKLWYPKQKGVLKRKLRVIRKSKFNSRRRAWGLRNPGFNNSRSRYSYSRSRYSYRRPRYSFNRSRYSSRRPRFSSRRSRFSSRRSRFSYRRPRYSPEWPKLDLKAMKTWHKPPKSKSTKPKSKPIKPKITFHASKFQ